MAADMESNKKLSAIVTELFLRRRKLNISFIFISQPSFNVPRTLRLNATHYCIVNIPNKRELQQISYNNLSDIDFKDFTKLYEDYTKEQYSFLGNNTKKEKAATMKRYEYSPLGKELKVQSDIAKKQYQKLDDTFEFEKITKK